MKRRGAGNKRAGGLSDSDAVHNSGTVGQQSLMPGNHEEGTLDNARHTHCAVSIDKLSPLLTSRRLPLTSAAPFTARAMRATEQHAEQRLRTKAAKRSAKSIPSWGGDKTAHAKGTGCG